MKNIPLRNIIAAALLAANVTIHAGPFDSIPAIPQIPPTVQPFKPLPDFNKIPKVEIPKPAQPARPVQPIRAVSSAGADEPALKDSPRPIYTPAFPAGKLAVTGDDEGCIKSKPVKPIRPIPTTRPIMA